MAAFPSGWYALARAAMLAAILTINASNAQSTDPVAVIDADFSVSRQRFRFVSDTYHNTDQPDYTSGSRYGQQASLVVTLGGKDNKDVDGMSGGWRRNFKLERDSMLQLHFDLRMFLSAGIDDGDDLDAMISIDDRTVGSTITRDFVKRLSGEDGFDKQDTGFSSFKITLGTFNAGEHELTIGGFFFTNTIYHISSNYSAFRADS